VAEKLDAIANEHGRNAIGVVGSPRATNEALFVLQKFATELIGTENYGLSDAFSLKPFFENLGAPLATHKEIRHARTILLIGGEPEELQPLTGKQIRQAVRNGGTRLIIVNSVPIRLREQASQFIHIRPGSEDAMALALADSSSASAWARKLEVEAAEVETARRTITEAEGDFTDILDRVRRLFIKRRWWILLTASAVILATVAVLSRLPNRYTSEATLLVVQQQVPQRYVVPNSTTDIAVALEAMKQEVLSRSRLQKIIKDFSLYAKAKKRLEAEEVITLMLRDIGYRTSRQSASAAKGFQRLQDRVHHGEPSGSPASHQYVDVALYSRELEIAGGAVHEYNQLLERTNGRCEEEARGARGAPARV
jgi:NADH dehydrogenase/NADH:ubiquinone oxidoreductase subunit G